MSPSKPLLVCNGIHFDDFFFSPLKLSAAEAFLSLSPAGARSFITGEVSSERSQQTSFWNEKESLSFLACATPCKPFKTQS